MVMDVRVPVEIRKREDIVKIVDEIGRIQTKLYGVQIESDEEIRQRLVRNMKEFDLPIKKSQQLTLDI